MRSYSVDDSKLQDPINVRKATQHRVAEKNGAADSRHHSGVNGVDGTHMIGVGGTLSLLHATTGQLKLSRYLDESAKSWSASLLSRETDLALVLSDKSPIELERRRLPSTGLFTGDCAWMKVLWTILTSSPSFHGGKQGSGGTVTRLAG